MKEDDNSSDVGTLWKEALAKHIKEADLEPALERQMKQQMGWDISSILQEQDRQLEIFSKGRHNGTTLDKLRSAIGRNSAVIVGVTTQIGNAASSSFPPAAAIVTAFTYVMKASNDVSADLDKIASFFDVMSSILQRVSIVEKKLPSIPSYKAIMTKVFSGLMIICGIATFYVKHGRFKQWLKALVSGQDDKLKSAYDDLERDIQRLESATLFATLAATADIKSDTKDLTIIGKQNLKVGMETLSISKESLSINIDTNMWTKDGAAASKESADGVKVLIKMYKEKQREEEAQKDDGKLVSKKVKDSGAKRSATLNHVKRFFENPAEPVIQFRDIENSFVRGTFSWIEHEESYKSFLDGTGNHLWIHGQRGLGKSCLAYSIIERLGETRGNSPRTSIAYFFFKEEHEELRSVKNLLSSVVIQVAVADEKYRNEVAADLVRPDGGIPSNDDGSQIWERFFVKKFSKDSDAKLFLVIDGIDEAEADGQAKLLKYLQQISTDELTIQVVLTGRSDMDLAVQPLQPLRIEITKQKLSEKSGDLWRIIMFRCKALSKLRQLKPFVRKKIAVKIRQRADSVLYVEHMLRRLNALGRENLIVKELEQLPSDLTALYALMLSDCEKNRSNEQLVTLKKLFAWLAYSKRPLTLGEAASLISVVEKQVSFSLEEEIDGRSARILQLGTNAADDDQGSDESDIDVADKNDEEDPTSDTDTSIYSPLRFQERSLRQYFRETSVHEAGLRSPPAIAHLTIFNMAVRCLDVLFDLTSANSISSYLQEYAANYWLSHFLDIKPDSIPDKDVEGLIESLQIIFDPNKNVLKSLENKFEDFGDEEHVWLFSGATDLKDKFLNSLKDWAERAAKLPAMVSANYISWIENFSNSPKDVMAQVARGHRLNWLSANNSWEARTSLRFAQAALLMTDLMPIEFNVTSQDEPSQEVILWIANSLDDTPQTSSAHRAIGMVLWRFNFYDTALLELEKSMKLCKSTFERFKTLQQVARVEIRYSEDERFKNDCEVHIGEAYKAISAALALRSEMKEGEEEIEKERLLLLQGILSDRLQMISEALQERSILEVKLGKLEEALRTVDEIRALIKNSDLSGKELNEIMKALEGKEQYDKIILALEKFSKWDLLVWLAWGSDDGNEMFRRAAKKCEKKDFMVQIYNSLIRWLDEFGAGPQASGARLQLAIAYQRVFPDFKNAKTLLYEVIEGKKGGAFYTGNTVFTARLNLTDILMEEFRNFDDPEEKSRIYAEMKRLAFLNRVALADDFKPYESQTAVPMAIMARKLGPASEFQTSMEQIFKGCITALTDNDGWNDNPAFRLLAKVLACVPGLEGDAQISISLQFSCVNKEVFDRQNESPDTKGTPPESLANAPNDSLVGENDEISGKDVINTSVSAQENSVEPANTTEGNSSIESAESKNESEATEDLLDDQGIHCDGCNKAINDWKSGPFYLCVICTDTDLCTECYDKIQARNRGGEWKGWRTFCGPHHRYIKGPMKDWRGVKDGVIRFGEEELAFAKWLEGLNETRWRKAWVNWWQYDDLENDIL